LKKVEPETQKAAVKPAEQKKEEVKPEAALVEAKKEANKTEES